MPAVTELIIAEMLYLQHKDRVKPMYLYINSTGALQGRLGGLFALFVAVCSLEVVRRGV